MLEVSRGTMSLSGKKAGSPMTHAAPRTVPDTEPKPPMTTIATSMSESVDREDPVARHPLQVGGEQGAPHRGQAPGQGEGPELRPGVRHRVGGRGVRVVADGDRPPADAGPPQARHQDDGHDQDDEGHVVGGPL